MALAFAVVFAVMEMLSAVQMPAIIATIMKQVFIQKAPLHMETVQQFMLTIGSILLLTVLCIVVFAITYGTVLKKLKEHHDTNTMTVPKRWLAICPRLMGRTLKGVFFSILMGLIPVLIVTVGIAVLVMFVGMAPYTMIITIVMLTLLIILLCLPLVFVFMKYVLNSGKSYFSLLPGTFAIGMRHWGHIFTAVLIGGLVVGMIIVVFSLPAAILSQAHYASQEGFLNGDILGMPDYITTLSFITYFLTGFGLVYLFLPMLMITYYLYGSIETYEQEKNKLRYEENIIS